MKCSSVHPRFFVNQYNLKYNSCTNCTAKIVLKPVSNFDYISNNFIRVIINTRELCIHINVKT